MVRRKAEPLPERHVRKVPFVWEKWPSGEQVTVMLTPIEDLLADLPTLDDLLPNCEGKPPKKRQKRSKNDETAAR